jgi:hypothetical protein
VVDRFTRECLVIDHRPSRRGVLALLVAMRGRPESIESTTAPKFISKVLDAWASQQGRGELQSQRHRKRITQPHTHPTNVLRGRVDGRAPFSRRRRPFDEIFAPRIEDHLDARSGSAAQW